MNQPTDEPKRYRVWFALMNGSQEVVAELEDYDDDEEEDKDCGDDSDDCPVSLGKGRVSVILEAYDEGRHCANREPVIFAPHICYDLTIVDGVGFYREREDLVPFHIERLDKSLVVDILDHVIFRPAAMRVATKVFDSPAEIPVGFY